MDVCGFCYFVVFKQVCGDVVDVVDLILGNCSLFVSEFFKVWLLCVVFVVIGSDFDCNMVLLQFGEWFSVCLLYVWQGLIIDVELVDFGFIYVDLF